MYGGIGMKKKSKKVVYTLLIVFLFAMAVMTIVSRIMNESHIPEVETQTPRSGTLVLEAVGRGVTRFGTLEDTRVEETQFFEDTYFVEGYFFEKDYLDNISVGSMVKLSIEGESIEGTLVAKMYNYREDTMDVLISLQEEKKYAAGCEVEFVLEDARVKYPTCISRELVYEGDDGYYIYVLKEQNSILGNITIAVKTPIHILAQNERAVAVAEELASDVQVILKGVPLEDGMRVRKREW